jgi:hypothetical protein
MLHPSTSKKFALKKNSTTSGGRSVSNARLQTENHEVCFVYATQKKTSVMQM